MPAKIYKFCELFCWNSVLTYTKLKLITNLSLFLLGFSVNTQRFERTSLSTTATMYVQLSNDWPSKVDANPFIIKCIFVVVDDEYDRLLNSFAITKDAIPNETHNDINQMVNFIENSGLVFTDMSFLMEWYILKQEKCVAKEIALAKLRYNIAELEMRASYATDEYSNAERCVFDLVSPIHKILYSVCSFHLFWFNICLM